MKIYNAEGKELFKKQPKLYTPQVAQDIVNKYLDAGCDVYQIEDGCCGIGDWICDGGGVYKSCVIKEVATTCWTSGQKIRFYNKMPKKYEEEIERWYNRLYEEETA